MADTMNAREQAREAVFAACMPYSDEEDEFYLAADAASDVWEIREQRLRTALLSLGWGEKSVEKMATGEMDVRRCEAVVYHGPGHQSKSQCQHFIHDEREPHFTNAPGYNIEWTDERPYS